MDSFSLRFDLMHPDGVVSYPDAAAQARDSRPHLVDVTMYWSARGGGVGRYLRDKRRWAGAHGWRNTWAVPADCAPPHRKTGGLRIPLSGGYRFPLARSHTARLLSNLQPDLIEAGDPFTLAWAALDAARERGIPAVTFCHSNPADIAARWFGPIGRSALRRYLRNVYRRFDAVFAASRWMVDEARDLGIENVVHQPLGVDLATFSPTRRDANWRSELGIDPDTVVLIYAGRFAREKNLQVLADTVKHLGSRYLLLALGAGPVPPRGDRVRLLPYATDPRIVATALASADVFVHAGESETFGLAPLEALACGTPVVMPARAGLLDLVDGRVAIGVAQTTPEALAEGVSAVRALSREEARHAAVHLAQSFDEETAFARLFARYAALRSASVSADKAPGGLRLA